jgi:hypothetical protein
MRQPTPTGIRSVNATVPRSVTPDAQQPRHHGGHGGEAVGPRAVLKAALFTPSEFHQKLGVRSSDQAVVATSNMRKAAIDNGSAPVRQTANQPTRPSGKFAAVFVSTPGGRK